MDECTVVRILSIVKIKGEQDIKNVSSQFRIRDKCQVEDFRDIGCQMDSILVKAGLPLNIKSMRRLWMEWLVFSG
jgi:hypothetical protein